MVLLEDEAEGFDDEVVVVALRQAGAKPMEFDVFRSWLHAGLKFDRRDCEVVLRPCVGIADCCLYLL